MLTRRTLLEAAVLAPFAEGGGAEAPTEIDRQFQEWLRRHESLKDAPADMSDGAFADLVEWACEPELAIEGVCSTCLRDIAIKIHIADYNGHFCSFDGRKYRMGSSMTRDAKRVLAA